MLDWLSDPFSLGIGQRALAEVVLLGFICGPLGVWVVLYRESYAAESLAHSMLPGLALAAVAGIPLGLGGAAGLLVAALAISLASRVRTVGVDVAIAVVVTTLFGAGALLALAPDVPPRLGELLFGNVLGISGGDLAVSALVGAVVIAALAGLHRPLSLGSFDPQTAASLGVSPSLAGLALLVLLALTTLVAVQALGNLLVVALIVAPAAAALRFGERLGPALTLSAGLAALSGVAGLYVSYYLDLAAGASIALCAVAIFALSLLEGLIPRARRRLSP
jgi:ABC-type Mn2+/Zn2+ transport system permease subunit